MLETDATLVLTREKSSANSALPATTMSCPSRSAPLDVRGRVVQLGPMLDQILERHDYPEPVARLLAEACVVTVLLGTSLKFEGKFILQTRTDGPVDMLVADFTTPGFAARLCALRRRAAGGGGRRRRRSRRRSCSARACWRSPSTRASTRSAIRASSSSTAPRWRKRRETYFRQSEQIPTDISLAVAKQVVPGEGGGEHWRAGGLLAQFLPEAPERLRMPDLPGGDGDRAWRENEPTDNAWPRTAGADRHGRAGRADRSERRAERLLYRLFHEHGVRVFEGARSGRRVLLLARQASAASWRLLGRGDQGEHRGRRDYASAASSARRATSSIRRSLRRINKVEWEMVNGKMVNMQG